MQQESNKSEQQLGVVTLDLAKTSKVADGILKKVRMGGKGGTIVLNKECLIEDRGVYIIFLTLSPPENGEVLYHNLLSLSTKGKRKNYNPRVFHMQLRQVNLLKLH